MAKKKAEDKYKEALIKVNNELLRLSTLAQSPAHRDAFACATEIASRELYSKKPLSDYAQYNVRTR